MGALLSPFSTSTELAQLIPPYVPQAFPWVGVRQRFSQLNQNTSLTLLQKVDGRTKLNGVLTCLNQRYYELSSGEANSLLIGSWGKDLATRPPRDVDVYFVLPPDVYYRFQNRLGNVQSALLQEVRGFWHRPIQPLRSRQTGTLSSSVSAAMQSRLRRCFC